MARSRNTADTQTASGGPVSPGIAGKNAIINGGMDIWQRGTSFAHTSTLIYGGDRWESFRASYATGMTTSRQAPSLTGFQYCTRVQRDSGNTGTGTLYFTQAIESMNSIPFAGQVITLSFYARAGANMTNSNALLCQIEGSNTTDQPYRAIGDGAGSTIYISSTKTLTTSWQRFTVTTTMTSSHTQAFIAFKYAPTGTAGAADYYEITGVQLELGSTATPFSRAGGTIQGELAACQRYYQKSYNTETAPQTNSTSPGGVMSQTGNVGVSGGLGTTVLKVEMRVAPTVTIYSYTSSTAARVSDNSGADLAANSGVANYIGTRSFNTQNLSAGTITAAFNGFLYHYVASAEL